MPVAFRHFFGVLCVTTRIFIYIHEQYVYIMQYNIDQKSVVHTSKKRKSISSTWYSSSQRSSSACQGWMKCLRLKKLSMRSLSFALLCFNTHNLYIINIFTKLCTHQIQRRKKRNPLYSPGIFYRKQIINRQKEQQKLFFTLPAASGKTKENSHKIYGKKQKKLFMLTYRGLK